MRTKKRNVTFNVREPNFREVSDKDFYAILACERAVEIDKRIQDDALKSEVQKLSKTEIAEIRSEKKSEKITIVPNKPYEEMSVEELQEAILEKMRKNGEVTDYMLGTVRENTHHGSLVNWVKSFN